MMIEQKRKSAPRILPIVLIFTALIMLSGCIRNASDSDMEQWVKIKCYYYGVNQNIVLGLEILLTGDTPMYSGHNLSFLINGKISKHPFYINKFWLNKTMVPNARKLNVDYFTEKEFGKLLGPGIKKMKWQYGPIFTNEISIEVMDDFTIREIRIEYDEFVKNLGETYYGNKKKEAIKESPISETKKDSDI